MNQPVSGALPLIQLKTERRSNHPWIFQKMVEKPANKPKPGSIVDIVDREGNFAGRGFYNGHSRIALRMLTADPDEAVDEAFFARKIAQAVALRRDVLKLDDVTNAYRLIHSEGDGLSGLVVDRFADTLVIEYFSAGMFRQRDLIRRCLLEHFPNANLYWFAEEHAEAGKFRLRNPVTARTDRHPRTWPAIPCRAGQQAQDRLLRRPARQPQDAVGILRRQARARPVLQLRRLRHLCEDDWRRERSHRRRPRRGHPRRRRKERAPQQGEGAFRAG
jgi:hypothetical protein